MSHPWTGSAAVEILAQVRTLTGAIEAVSAGARLVDAGRDEALVAAIRRAVPGAVVCGHGEGADIAYDAALAVRTGAGLICADAVDADRAVRHAGVPRERVLVLTSPADIGSRAGWAALVDVDERAGRDAAWTLAGVQATAAVCAWQGARVLRTRHVAQVRRCLDMTESIMGIRPPACAIRGLA